MIYCLANSGKIYKTSVLHMTFCNSNLILLLYHGLKSRYFGFCAYALSLCFILIPQLHSYDSWFLTLSWRQINNHESVIGTVSVTPLCTLQYKISEHLYYYSNCMSFGGKKKYHYSYLSYVHD